jgi:protocatechuate 3,4-dioxygenase beta subunit
MSDHNFQLSDVPPGTQPPYLAPDYRSTLLRSPKRGLVKIPLTATETMPVAFPENWFTPTANLALNGTHEAMGERIIVTGHVLDEDGCPVPRTMVEIWQANAAGRYNHAADTHDAPLDENFKGAGRIFTDDHGAYRFLTVKPGAYPWGNHHNAWRPNHIHFSLFGYGFATRLITQMYFPGDPLLALDPIYHTVPDEAARQRLIAAFDIGVTEPNKALGYRFNIVLRGRLATPMEG